MIIKKIIIIIIIIIIILGGGLTLVNLKIAATGGCCEFWSITIPKEGVKGDQFSLRPLL